MTVPAHLHGLPPAIIRMKARQERERERQEQQQLVASMHELMDNQRTLRALVNSQSMPLTESVQ